ncbi:MAG: type II toxin-antitoxin system VapC family toxin [Methylacidiphilaceae bacterium]|nr:type II toxin-antitoxin system VapC family toxin [Candidatus Methylacidiphilaceae bacterium]
MSGVVIDSSLALTWLFEDEASPETDILLERVRDDGAVVPGLWYLELSNVLLQAERRGRITASDGAMRLDLIAELPISVDPETTARAWREILTIARTERLTTYDATYLELAVRRGLPLLTKDNELAEAANRQGVVVLPPQAKTEWPPPTKRRRRGT